MQSAWLKAVGKELGFPGTAAAAMDPHADPPPNAKDTNLIRETIQSCFDARDVAAGLVADVNQRGSEVERYVTHKALVEWAAPANGEQNQSFDSHSVFYNADEPTAYEGAVPKEGTEFEPFLSANVAMEVLSRLYSK